MKDLNITINANTRQPKFTRNFIGVNGEYLNGYIVVDFEDEFIEGMATLEVEIGANKYMLAMERGADDYYYSVQIKSSLLAKAGKIYCQIRIDTLDDQVFKCRRFPLFVLEAINAETTIPEDYKDIIQQIEEQINEVKNNYVPKTRTINNKALSQDITLTPEDIGLEQITASEVDELFN